MKRKLLSLLVLLMTAVTGAWATEVTIATNQQQTSYTSGDITISVSMVGDGDGAQVSSWCPMSITCGDGNVLQSVVVTIGYYPENASEVTASAGSCEVSGDGNKHSTYVTVTGINASSVSIGCNGDVQIEQVVVNYGPSAPAVIASGDCGTGVTWTLTSDGVMTISGTGAMEDYADPNLVPWYSNKDAITSVVIESGVTSIGDYAFCDCENLASVSIPASVTSIGDDAFSSCGTSATALTVTFAEGSTLTTIGYYAFLYANLPSISIPNSVTTIGESAFDNSGLTSVNLPTSLTSIGVEAFKGCNMTTIDIPASVTSIDMSAFADCSDLETITLNSNPFIDYYAFDNIKDGATVTMNLPANLADGAKWTTFYNENYRFKADANTQVFKVELSGTTLTMHEVTAKIVYGGTPVVLKTTGDGNPVMTLTTDAVEDTQPNTLSGWAGPGNLAADGNMYVLNYTTTNGVGFYKLKDGKSLGVGKAFLYYNGSGSGAREFFGFGDASGIESVRVNEGENGEVYDLQGRRVSQPTKGLYIVNGKKVVIK